MRGEEIDSSKALIFDEMCNEKKVCDEEQENIVEITPYKRLGQIKAEYIELDEELNTLRQCHLALCRNSFPENRFFKVKPKNNEFIQEIESNLRLSRKF